MDLSEKTKYQILAFVTVIFAFWSFLAACCLFYSTWKSATLKLPSVSNGTTLYIDKCLCYNAGWEACHQAWNIYTFVFVAFDMTEWSSQVPEGLCKCIGFAGAFSIVSGICWNVVMVGTWLLLQRKGNVSNETINKFIDNCWKCIVYVYNMSV